jgi:hypothetical protein
MKFCYWAYCKVTPQNPYGFPERPKKETEPYGPASPITFPPNKEVVAPKI